MAIQFLFQVTMILFLLWLIVSSVRFLKEDLCNAIIKPGHLFCDYEAKP